MSRSDAYEQLTNSLDRLSEYGYTMPESFTIRRSDVAIIFSQDTDHLWIWTEYDLTREVTSK